MNDSESFGQSIKKVFSENVSTCALINFELLHMEIIALMHCLIMVFAIFEQALHFFKKI